MSNAKAPSYEATVRVRDACLCLHLQRAARTVARLFDEAFRPLGLTSGQFSLLMSLNRPDPPTLGGIAQLLAMDRTTLTAALKPLERRGLVRVALDTADRRIRRPALTPSGAELLAAAVSIWRAAHAAIEGRLGADPELLRALLRAFSATAPLPASATGAGAASPVGAATVPLPSQSLPDLVDCPRLCPRSA